MVTKYILVGGCDYKAPDGGKALCEALTEGFGEPVKILICLFALPKEKWEAVFQKDKEFFAQHLSYRSIEIKLAQPEKFVEQVRWAHAIYIRGGTPAPLIDTLRQVGDWAQELKGKTIAGSSAGADALVKYTYDLDTLKPNEGLGLLPIKVITHWRSDYNTPNIHWESALEELKQYGDKSIPIHALKEGEYIVIKQ